MHLNLPKVIEEELGENNRIMADLTVSGPAVAGTLSLSSDGLEAVSVTQCQKDERTSPSSNEVLLNFFCTSDKTF